MKIVLTAGEHKLVQSAKGMDFQNAFQVINGNFDMAIALLKGYDIVSAMNPNWKVHDDRSPVHIPLEAYEEFKAAADKEGYDNLIDLFYVEKPFKDIHEKYKIDLSHLVRGFRKGFLVSIPPQDYGDVTVSADQASRIATLLKGVDWKSVSADEAIDIKVKLVRNYIESVTSGCGPRWIATESLLHALLVGYFVKGKTCGGDNVVTLTSKQSEALQIAINRLSFNEIVGNTNECKWTDEFAPLNRRMWRDIAVAILVGYKVAD